MKKVGKILAWVFGILIVLLLIAGVALYRPDISYEKLEAKYAVPTSKFVNLNNGVRMHYREDGVASGPIVVLVHGYGDSFLTWDAFIKQLTPRYRVLTIDLPGHGLTRAPKGFVLDAAAYADLVDDFAARLDLPKFTLVGNSMGGGVAWLTAVRHPERLNGLVLMDAAGWPAETLTKPPLVFRILGSPFGRFMLQHVETRPLTASGLKMDVVDTSMITPEFVDRWVEVQRAPGHRAVLMSRSLNTTGVATPEVVSRIRTPTLVLHGEQDKIIDVKSGRKFAETIPGARLIVYPDAGHLPQYEIPERSAADVAAFVDSLGAPTGAPIPENRE